MAGQVQAVSVGARLPQFLPAGLGGGSPCRAGRGGRHKGRDVVAKGAAGRLGEGVLGLFEALVALCRRGGQAQELDSLVDFCMRRVLHIPEYPL